MPAINISITPLNYHITPSVRCTPQDQVKWSFCGFSVCFDNIMSDFTTTHPKSVCVIFLPLIRPRPQMPSSPSSVVTAIRSAPRRPSRLIKGSSELQVKWISDDGTVCDPSPKKDIPTMTLTVTYFIGNSHL